jgi:hypothetical protein
MSRQLRPLTQGDLDGLCGIYSIINATLLALHTMNRRGRQRARCSPLTQPEQDDLFLALVTCLVFRRNAVRLVVDGISTTDLRYALARASAWLAERRDLRLVVERPLDANARVTRPRLAVAIKAHLANPGAAAIVGLEHPLSHWSVVSAVTRRRLLLLDSDGHSDVSLGHNTRGACPIDSKHVFLLSLRTLVEGRPSCRYPTACRPPSAAHGSRAKPPKRSHAAGLRARAQILR